MHEEFVIPSLFFLRLSRHWKSRHLCLTYYRWGGVGVYEKPINRSKNYPKLKNLVKKKKKNLHFLPKTENQMLKNWKPGNGNGHQNRKPENPNAPLIWHTVYTVLRHKSCKYWNFKGFSEPGYLWQVAALSSTSEAWPFPKQMSIDSGEAKMFFFDTPFKLFPDLLDPPPFIKQKTNTKSKV